MFKYGIFLTILMSVIFFACSQQQVTEKAEKPNIHFENEFFYNSDGSFNVERGRDAYIALMKYHGYPIFDGLREGLWVSDYGLGKFTELGLGAYGFINQSEDKGGYLGQDMYLLPNQMLPEHYHLQTPKAKPKMEGWHVRYGLSYTYGEGDSTLSSHIKIPDFEKAYVSVYHETPLAVGQTAVLNRETARHWQFGGPEGAIISEYGSYHDNDAVRHSDPNIVFP
jgi:D-lyxose ketol-isomerase